MSHKEERVHYPTKPMPTGVCHECSKPLHKVTALFCTAGCRTSYYGIPCTSELEEMMFDGVVTTPDGCEVEPDGECPHGHKSWLILLGIC